MQNSFSSQSFDLFFKRAETLFKEQKILEAKDIYIYLLSSKSLSLFPNLQNESLINLSTIYIQLNDLEQAQNLLRQAIQLNPDRYEAFYNLAITNYYSEQNLNQAILCLEYCLSLLYLQSGTLSGSLKLINKSISLNNLNAKAYINRALLYQKNQKIKLASNQYEKLTFQNQFQDFSQSIITDIYLQKSLFYRRTHQTDKMQQNLIIYNQLKKQQKDIEKHVNPKVKQILQNTKTEQEDPNQLKLTIIDLIREAQQLIKDINATSSKQQKEQQSPNIIQNIVISQVKQIKPRQQNIRGQRFFKQTQKIEEQNLLFQDSQISEKNNLKSKLQTPVYSQQHGSISINEDEDSAILNQKIQQLQKQIQQSGGNVPQVKDISRNSQEENFLQFQIQKTIQEINKKKKQSYIKKNPNIKTQRSSIDNQKNPSNIETFLQNRKSSIHEDMQDAMTLRSKISQSYEINMEQMKNYSSFQLDVRSVSLFDENSPRKEAYIKFRYLDRQLLTEKCKNEKLTWNHVFDWQKINHQQEKQDNLIYQIEVQLHAKQGGWLSRSHDVLLATGTIKLTEKGTTHCTLQHNSEKVGILYYRIKLQKVQVQTQV